MTLSANLIRDTVVTSLSLTHDWDSESHVLVLSVVSEDGESRSFRLTGLSQVEISDDLKSMHIAFCTLLFAPGRVYLSLDPYEEGLESDKDNYCFVGKEITQNCLA